MPSFDKLIALLVLLVLTPPSVISKTVNAIVIYSDSQCNGTPVRVFMTESSSCTNTGCSEGEYNGGVQYRTTACVESNRFEYVADIFNGVSYVTLDGFSEDGCYNLSFSSSYLAAGTCQSGTTNATVITKLYANGSASIHAFGGLSCAEMASSFILDEETIANHTCVQDRYQFYSSASKEAAGTLTGPSRSGGSPSSTAENSVSISIAGIVGIAAGVFILLVLCIAAMLLMRKRSKQGGQDHEFSTSTGVTPTKSSYASLNLSTAHVLSSQKRPKELTGTTTGMWNDDVIVAARLPREKVLVEDRISRGGYGEVYIGKFNEQTVAVKMLLPETRKNISNVNEFLAEVKIMAMMEHPRITRFIGVAWDSLADLCVISEYMSGGDLRALLNKFEEEQYPKGFDKDKVKIALHIAHALTYLHSLQPSVIHRDLKARNILLSDDLDAKLTDFGISRERVDQTMTAGVGSSLWMAPEVMLGEKYDSKVDVFSFGVVLSELDSHTPPYAHAKDSSNFGRKMPDAVLLQQVALGKLSVHFTESRLQSMKALGQACVSVDPKQRPTSAEALGKLHQILNHEM